MSAILNMDGQPHKEPAVTDEGLSLVAVIQIQPLDDKIYTNEDYLTFCKDRNIALKLTIPMAELQHIHLLSDYERYRVSWNAILTSLASVSTALVANVEANNAVEEVKE